MNLPAIVCPYDKKLLQTFTGRELAVRVERIDEAAPAAADVRSSGNTLLTIIAETDLPLDKLELPDGLAGIPLVIIARSFGEFRNLARRVDALRGLGLSIHLPCDSPENIAGLRVLSSLGIHCCAVLGQGRQDWEALADLMTYVILGPLPHAPIEPFAHIASHYEPSTPLPFEWDFLYFNDQKRFVHMDEKGRPQRNEGTVPPDTAVEAHGSPCLACGGYAICHGRFSAIAPEEGCRDFFLEMIDVAHRFKKLKEPRALATEPPGADAAARSEDIHPRKPAAARKSKTARKKDGETHTIWIEPHGGPATALMLSGVLKHVIRKYPGRRYNLIPKAGWGPILNGHPAIARAGYPPRGATIITTAWWEQGIFPKPGIRAYQVLARTFGLETPVEESLYVPWDLEDDPVLMGIVPRKDRNVLICTGSDSPRKEMTVDRWESLVTMLAKDGIGVVQAGEKKDRYVRGAYNIAGLLTPKQLISLPRHFDAVITPDSLMMHAARLCRTPAIVLWGPTDHAVQGYTGDIHLNASTPCEHTGRCIASAADCPGEFARCMNTIPVKTIHSSIISLVSLNGH